MNDHPTALLDQKTPVVCSTTAGFPEIDEAHQVLVDNARERVAWLDDPESLVASLDGLHSTELRRLAFSLATAGTSDVMTISRGGHCDEHIFIELSPIRSWTVGSIAVGVPDSLTLNSAIQSGGLVVQNAERRHPVLADIADVISTALSAQVRISLVTGEVPIESFGDGFWLRPAVIAVGAPAELQLHDGGAIILGDGTGRRVADPSHIKIGPGGVAVAIGIREPMLHDLWTTMQQAAGFWPRLRLDLPLDPQLKSGVYGFESATSAVEVVRSTVRSNLLGEEGALNAASWWRANLLPAPRPPVDPHNSLPTSVVGCFPGGLGFVRRSGEGITGLMGAAGGWIFPVPAGHTELLTDLVSGENIVVNALDQQAAKLIEHLMTLGLARPSDHVI
ncbi:MAG: hypothetical protein IPH38_19640 [Candidatus Microthrix sp.]|nr:hypothetical protein [Candidatus Microthrix sp.]MBK7021736.1 hypothetical protein [Candidatus Microthrix sp.]